MAKHEGVKTVVVGGQKDIPQQYCRTVGDQSTDFSTIDTEIQSTALKNHELKPPDFLTNSVQGITWRLGFGIDYKDEPEEWEDLPADLNYELNFDNVNNPVAIWTQSPKACFPRPASVHFRVQTA
ncbi:putative peptidase family S41 [Lyophyllum shimeji]|uniref:Peptidase family S41 n=1 Tax=Lyophyllum shimeji TaxID=47721 RepID=A0A9P3PGC9_LYOSH|nr:putative peptidase family S41 [Lyophyllum shimeji]